MTGRRRGMAALRADLNQAITHDDEAISELLVQVVAIEEVLAAPWWRQARAAARWRRGVAASIRHIQGRGFTERRLNTLSSGWLSGPGTRHAPKARGTDAS